MKNMILIFLIRRKCGVRILVGILISPDFLCLFQPLSPTKTLLYLFLLGHECAFCKIISCFIRIIFSFIPGSDFGTKYQGLCPGQEEWASWWESVEVIFMEVLGEYCNTPQSLH